jgi:hypothetical protein
MVVWLVGTAAEPLRRAIAVFRFASLGYAMVLTGGSPSLTSYHPPP